jgi:hypothetical protein
MCVISSLVIPLFLICSLVSTSCCFQLRDVVSVAAAYVGQLQVDTLQSIALLLAPPGRLLEEQRELKRQQQLAMARSWDHDSGNFGFSSARVGSFDP